MIATLLVIANFCLPGYYCITLSAKEMALAFCDSTTTLGLAWAYVFKLYIASNFGLWSTVFYKLIFLQGNHPSENGQSNNSNSYYETIPATMNV
jgi:hypothetical protein